MKKLFSIMLAILILCISVPAYAHPGSLDKNGGHYVRGTGEYHYHHGYPAHQHENGVCPYNYDDQTGQSSGESSTSKQNNSEVIGDCTQAYDKELEEAFSGKEEQKKQSQENQKKEEAQKEETNFLKYLPGKVIEIILGILFYGWIAVILISAVMPFFVFIASIPSKIKKKKSKSQETIEPHIQEKPAPPPQEPDEEYPIPERVTIQTHELIPDPNEYLWTEWEESVHDEDGQSDRIKRALEQNFKIERRISEDEYQITGTTGSQYLTSLRVCTCPDFKFRKRPCKHMYALANSQGLFVPSHYLNRPMTTPWSVWDDSIHRTKEQAERIQQAKKQNIVILKKTRDDTYLILGTQGDKFLTSLQQCTCPDYQRRGLPCKHMYALAISEDVFAPLQYLPRPQSPLLPDTKN